MKGGTHGSATDKPRVNHTSLVPVTLKQLQMSAQDPNEDKLIVDGRDVTQVRVVGQITRVETSENGLNYTLELDDGSATMEVRVFTPESPMTFDYHFVTKGNWVVDAYVEVFGHVKMNARGRSIVAQRVNVITDFNLITHHFLQVIHAHLYAIKGGSISSGVSQVTSGISGIQRFDSYSAMHAPDAAATLHNPYNNAMDTSGSKLADPVERAVHNLCLNAPMKGFAQDYIISQLQSQFTPDQVITALNRLTTIGDVYSTGNNSFKS